MPIRSQISVDNKDSSLRGYVDFGELGKELGIKSDDSQLAKEMLAFQIVSYFNKFEFPVAHFL